MRGSVHAEVVGEDAGDAIGVERARRRHLLEVGPVLRAIEERLEHREVGAPEERHVPAERLRAPTALRDLLVELGGVDEHVDRRLAPPEPDLTVALDAGAVVVGPRAPRPAARPAARACATGRRTRSRRCRSCRVPSACTTRARARRRTRAGCGRRRGRRGARGSCRRSALTTPGEDREVERHRVARRELLGELEHLGELAAACLAIGAADGGRELDAELEAGGPHDAVEGLDRGHLRAPPRRPRAWSARCRPGPRGPAARGRTAVGPGAASRQRPRLHGIRLDTRGKGLPEDLMTPGRRPPSDPATRRCADPRTGPR